MTRDHDAQQAALAAAVWDLVARSGLEAVSLRAVAAAAGVSMGRVQYYFATKDELLIHSLRHAHRRMEERIRHRLAGTDGSDRAVLLAILDELLGEHPETRGAIRVHLAFAARALDDERVAAALTEGDEEILALATRVVAQARAAGRVGVDVDPERDGHALWVLARGLGTDVALYGAPVQQARLTLEHLVGRVAPAP